MKTLRINILFVLCLGMNIMSSWGQTLLPGSPPYSHYKPEITGASTGITDIGQSFSGSIYFANKSGLLVFDGLMWDLVSPGKLLNIQSIKVLEDRIYAGGPNNFGYFVKGNNNNFQYTDLLQTLKPKGLPLLGINAIKAHTNMIFIKAGNDYYKVENETLVKWNPEINIDLMENVEGKLLAYDSDSGLYIYTAGKFRKINGSDVIRNEEIISMISYKPGQLLLSSSNGNIFKYDGERFDLWKSNDEGYLARHGIQNAVKVSNELFAFGTATGGLVLVNNLAKTTGLFNDDTGLKNDNVHSLLADVNKNIWISTEQGITVLKMDSPLYFIEPRLFSGFNGIDLVNYQDKIYMATSKTIFVSEPEFQDTESGEFAITDMQVSSDDSGKFHIIDDNLWFSSASGIVQLNQEGTRRIYSGEVSDLLQIENSQILLVANQFGLNIYEAIGSEWVLKSVIDTVLGPCYGLFQDHFGKLYAKSARKGIVRILYNDAQDDYEVGEFDNRKRYNGFYSFAKNIVLKSDDGFDILDPETGEIKPYTLFDPYFKISGAELFLEQDPQGNIWFVNDNEIGVLKITDEGLQKSINKISFPSLKGKVTSFNPGIYAYEASKAYINTVSGFVHVDLDFFKGVQKPEIQLNSVVSLSPNNKSKFIDLTDAALGIDSAENAREDLVFYKPENSLRFYFNSSLDQQGDIQYSTKLEGLNDEWSEWGVSREILYNNLPTGSYIFKLRSRSANNMESTVIGFPFKVRKLWYYSNIAIIIYGFLTLLLIYFLSRRQIKKAKSEAHEIKSKQEDLEKKFKVISEIKHEKEKEIKEVHLHAALKPHLQTAEPYRIIKERLTQLMKEAEQDEVSRDSLKSLKQYVDEKLNFQKDWDMFAENFDQIHDRLLQRLMEKYPELNNRDLRLCAYVRLGLRSKEIAPLLNISERGVEVNRYRLRKKLELESGVKLKDFLDKF